MSHDNWEARAKEWITSHPTAMKLFETLALQAAGRNRKFGIGLLTERIRWEMWFEREDGEQFKLNNNYRAYIARELVARHPHLEQFLEFRSVEGDTETRS